MAKYLISTTENYRVDSEAEAKKLIEDAKANSMGILTKYGSVFKERKQKGECIDEWYRVTLTTTFTDEKEPENVAAVKYIDPSEID